jgi:hypothetical protein
MSGNSGGPLEATRGRFWAISPEEDSDDESPAAGTTSSLALYYSTPVEDDGRDLASTTLSAVDRREQKRQRQCAAALALRPGTPPSTSPFRSNLLSLTPTPESEMMIKCRTPVLSPTTFFLDDFDPDEWILVQRRNKKLVRSRRRRVWPPVGSDHRQQ